MENKQINTAIKQHLQYIVAHHSKLRIDGSSKMKQVGKLTCIKSGDSCMLIEIDDEKKHIRVAFEIDNFDKVWKHKLAKFFAVQEMFVEGKYTVIDKQRFAVIEENIRYIEDIDSDALEEAFRVYDEMLHDLAPVYNMCSDHTK